MTQVIWKRKGGHAIPGDRAPESTGPPFRPKSEQATHTASQGVHTAGERIYSSSASAPSSATWG